MKLSTMIIKHRDNICKYCGAGFSRPTTLATHVCVKKRRYMEMNAPASRLGFKTFQRFYDLTSSTKKQQTMQEFIESPYYIDFVKFGNHLVDLKPVHLEQFIDFVIKNSVKLKDWTKDFVYYTYIEDLIKKEPATAAVDRTITYIVEWSMNNNSEFSDFFHLISANEASQMIRAGKISPWVIYLSKSGGKLLDTFGEDHASIIGAIIDPGFWMKKFKKAIDDVEYIRTLLIQVGV